MDLRLKQWIALALASYTMYVCGGATHAEPRDVLDQLETLRHSLDQAESANSAVRKELDEALVRSTDDWLSRQRVETITALVQDIIADSDARLSLQGSGAMMGWSDGFHLASADGRFLLNIGGVAQTRYHFRWQGLQGERNSGYDKWRGGFGIPRTQLKFGGHAFGRGLEYYLETGWGYYDPKNVTADVNLMVLRLWDAWVKFRLTPEVGLKIGQFNLPFTRETLVRPPYHLAIEKTNIDFRMGLGNSTGVELDWANHDRRFLLALSNGSGALFHVLGQVDPVAPLAAFSRDTLYSVTMRHEWKLLGDWDQFKQFTSPPGSERGLLIGLAGHRQNKERDFNDDTGGFPDGAFWGITGDVSMQFDGASLFGAIIYQRVTDFNLSNPRVNWLAAVVQGSTYISNKTELFARWEGGGPDRDVFGGNNLHLVTLGFNHYLDGQDLKFSTDIGFSLGEVSAVMANTLTGWTTDTSQRDQALFRTQLQLMF
jgi:hypothetical protein